MLRRRSRLRCARRRAAAATSWRPIRRRSRRAGCATSSSSSRNFKQWFKKGRTTATLMTGIEQWLLPRLGIKAPPWTLHREKADHLYLKPAAECTKIVYPKPDGKLTFDRLSSVFVSNTNHAEDQPAHLTLKDPRVPVQRQPGEVRRPGEPLLPGRRCTSSSATRQRAAADQRPELRPLQDLRHQGPDPEHRLGHARRRRRAELRRHVMPVAVVRGAVDPASARAWLAAVDAHPAWRPGAPPGPDFDRYSSSLRAGAVPALDLEKIALLLLGAEVGTLARSRLGAALVLAIDRCWVRRQYAPSRIPPGHAPHRWHQDGALGFDFLAAPSCRGRPAADGHLLDRPHALRRRRRPARASPAASGRSCLPLAALNDARVRARHPEGEWPAAGARRRRCPRLRRRRAAPDAGDDDHDPRSHQPRAALLPRRTTRRCGCAATASCPCTDTRETDDMTPTPFAPTPHRAARRAGRRQALAADDGGAARRLPRSTTGSTSPTRPPSPPSRRASGRSRPAASRRCRAS